MTANTDVWSAVVGQPAAVAQLQSALLRPVHAYLFTGPPGTGKRAAARVFAAGLLCPAGGGDGCDHCRRALAGGHPDLTFLERQGAAISVGDAREITRVATLSPVEAVRKVLVLTDFHLVEQAAPALLKTIEEPPASTVFVILADHVPPELVTIASRCCRIEFSPLPPNVIVSALQGEGVDEATAGEVAAAAGGNLDRARLLAGDPGFKTRVDTWRAVPGRLDGSGAAAAAAVVDVVAAIDTVAEPVKARHEAELQAIAERQKAYGEPVGGRRDLEARHRREQRRVRTDELRSGLAILAGHYRDRLASGSRAPAADMARIDAITAAAEALIRYPNEALLLQALFVKLSRDGA